MGAAPHVCAARPAGADLSCTPRLCSTLAALVLVHVACIAAALRARGMCATPHMPQYPASPGATPCPQPAAGASIQRRWHKSQRGAV